VKAKKYLVDKEAVCTECIPAVEYCGPKIDAWAKRHAEENPGHIVTIHETHDVSVMPPLEASEP
jgi:hypothetical protein